MPDIVSKEVRSRMMSGIRGKDTAPEMLVRRYMHRAGLRYRLHVKVLPGRPDIVVQRHRTVVFVHGCFWHCHQGCKDAAQPKTRPEFWMAKLDGNVARDARDQRLLVDLGWRVLTVWECETTPDRLDRLVREIRSDR
jgi:DNA mismatch endonuclease (patch repair protein)